MKHMKISSVEPWIENVRETRCLDDAFKQNTNDDDVIFNSYVLYKRERFSNSYGPRFVRCTILNRDSNAIAI